MKLKEKFAEDPVAGILYLLAVILFTLLGFVLLGVFINWVLIPAAIFLSNNPLILIIVLIVAYHKLKFIFI